MNNDNQLNEQENEISKMESIYNDTVAEVKMFEQLEKKAISDYLKIKEQEKIEQIRESLSN